MSKTPETSDTECVEEYDSGDNTEDMYSKLENIKVPKKCGPGRPKKGKKLSAASRRKLETSTLHYQEDKSESSAGTLMQQLVDEVRNLGSQVRNLKEEVSDSREEIKIFTSQIVDLLKRVTDLEGENRDLRGEMKKQNERTYELQERVDRIEMKELAGQFSISCPEIEGMAENNFKPAIISKIAAELKIAPTTLNQFSYKRIGKQGKKRALVTVCKTEDRAQFFVAARNLRPANFFVNEVLVKSREHLFYEVRKHKKQTNGRYLVYTYFGEVYLKRDRNSVPILLRCLNDLLNNV